MTNLNHDEKFDLGKVKLVTFISFLMGFSQAMIFYILSYYFERVFLAKNVGLLYLIAYFIMLVVFLNIHKLVKKLGKSAVLFFSSLAKVVLAASLVLFPPSVFSLLLALLYIVAVAVESVAVDFILESFSRDNVSGRVRGLHLTILNTGILLAPFISTQILKQFDFSGIFAFLVLFNSLILGISLIGLQNVNHRFEKKESIWSLTKKVWKRHDIRKIYYISFVLEAFYSLMIIYTPLYLQRLGVGIDAYGIITTIMLVPFVLIQYPAGVLADKKMGEKEMLIFGLLLMSLATLWMTGIVSTSIAVWGMVMFMTRVGAALTEVLRDSYFYKRIDGHDVDLINFFRTAMPLGYIVTSGLSFWLLTFLPLKSVFFFTSFLVFSALIPAFFLKDNKSEMERKNTL